MFTINDDKSIYITRGDSAFFSIEADNNGTPYKFQPGDVVRFKVFAKKDCEVVVLQKDFPITEESDTAEILLDERDTKIGGVISKPVDYWYEVELNPFNEPQTIIGYDEDGAKVFRLFPEGRDLEEYEYTEEDIPFMDDELDLTSTRPVENQAVARAVAKLSTDISKTKIEANRIGSEIEIERARINNLVTAETTEAELVDIRVGIDGDTYDTASLAIHGDILTSGRKFGLFRGVLLIDTEAKTASLSRTDGTDNKTHLITHFNRQRTRSVDVTFDTDTAELITSAACLVVINLENSTFSVIKGSDYQRAVGDVILCGYSDSVVYPFELSAESIMVDGYKLSDQNMRAEVEEQITSYQRAKFVIWDKKLSVDSHARTVTLPACYFSIYPNFARLKEIADPQTVTWDESMKNILYFVVLSVDGFTLSIQERTYEFTKEDICLGGLLYDKFIPVQIEAENVDFGNAEVDTPTMDSFFAGMFNNDRPFKIVLGGDSITHGVGGTGWEETGEEIITVNYREWHRSPNSYCWAKLFKDYIEANYNATVTNNGCTGTNSDWWNSNKESLIPSDTDLFILMVGTNDRNVRTDNTTKAKQLANYEKNLRDIIDYCHNAKIKVLLCSPIPASISNEEESIHLASCFDLNGIVQKVCASYNMPYVNMYNEVFFYVLDSGKDYEALLADGLHPTDELYRIMYYRLLKSTGLAPHYQRVN